MSARPEPPAAISDRPILVTGASGFLGSHLCRRLCERGAEVHRVSRRLRETPEPERRWWRADLGDIASVRELVHAVKPGAIVHLSGCVDALPDRELVLPTLHSLLVSTVNVLTAAAELGQCRVVLAASLREPEDAEAAPDSPYSAAKWAGSAYGRMFHRLYGLPVVIVRPFMTYGPGQNVRKLIPHVLLALLQGEAPRLSSGTWQADWIYVDDVTEAFVAALAAPSLAGCTVDLGSGRLASVRTIVQHLVELTGSAASPRFGALPERPLERVRVADVQHAYSKLGWRASTPLLDGLARTVEWYACRRREGVL